MKLEKPAVVSAFLFGLGVVGAVFGALHSLHDSGSVPAPIPISDRRAETAGAVDSGRSVEEALSSSHSQATREELHSEIGDEIKVIASDPEIADIILEARRKKQWKLPTAFEMCSDQRILSKPASIPTDQLDALQKAIDKAASDLAEFQDSRTELRQAALDKKVAAGDFELIQDPNGVDVLRGVGIDTARIDGDGSGHARVTRLLRKDLPELDSIDSLERETILSLAKTFRDTISKLIPKREVKK